MRQLSRSRILSLEFSNQLCNTCGWSSGVCHCCSRNSMVMQTGTNLSRSSWAKAKSSKDGSKASKACAKAVGDYWWCRLSLRMVTLRATESRPRCLLVCASSSLSRMPPVIIIGLQFAHALCSDYTTVSEHSDLRSRVGESQVRQDSEQVSILKRGVIIGTSSGVSARLFSCLRCYSLVLTRVAGLEQ